MTFQEIMSALEANGSEQTKKIFKRHGAREPFFGVKVAFLKTIVREVKKNHDLSLQLYATGNSDAMYLAGLIAEPQKMSKAQLQFWAEKAYWYMLSEYTVAWVTSESKYALELALEWITSEKEFIATAGWATLSSYVSITPDRSIDLKLFTALLQGVPESIHTAPNRVGYSMNGFIIAVGCYVTALSSLALSIAEKVGKVTVFMGETSCKVPIAKAYIAKVAQNGKVGNKRKTAIC